MVTQCKQLEVKLSESIQVNNALRQERDVAIDGLRRQGLNNAARQILDSRGSSSMLESLLRQNGELRQVIGHMRTEMEQLLSTDGERGTEQTCPKGMVVLLWKYFSVEHSLKVTSSIWRRSWQC